MPSGGPSGAARRLRNPLSFFFKIYLFLVVLGLRFCARAFPSCGKRGPLFIAVCGPLSVAASLVAEHRLHTRRLSNCGSRAQLLRGMWDLPRPGLEPVSPALAGRLSTTAPPGKPRNPLLISLPWKRQSVPKTGSINGRLTAGQTFRPELRSAPRKGNELFIWETQALLIDHGDLEY